MGLEEKIVQRLPINESDIVELPKDLQGGAAVPCVQGV